MSRCALFAVTAALCTTLALPSQLSAQATVTCKDGTTATQTGRGACSHHGGVAAAAATVSCKDGTTADAGRGACSHHGGVETATKSTRRSSTRASRASQQENTVAAEESSTGETVSCRDGTSASAGRGACSHHGGVGAARATATTREPSVRYAGTTSRTRVACEDGTTSRAVRGACSHHGGVASSASADTSSAQVTTSPRQDLPGTAAPVGVTGPAGATALCNDGTYSESAHHTGACSHHGGVRQWL
jgi:Protein of unknown function (DUF3761)